MSLVEVDNQCRCLLVRFLSFIIAPFFTYPHLKWDIVMALDEIQKLLEDGLPGCQVSVAGDDSSISLQVVGEIFEGLSF